MMQGRLTLAEELNREALALSDGGPNRTLIEDQAMLQQWFLDDERGRREALEDALEGFANRFSSFRSWTLPLALVRLAAGEPHDAQSQLEDFAAEGLDRLPRDANWLTTTTLLAEISYALNHKELAPALYELLLPYGEQCVVIGFAAVCRGSVSTQLGQLATMLGRWDAAEGHFSRALATNQRLEAHSALARTQYLYAHARLIHSRASDRDGARKLLEETAQTASKLGMGGLVLQVATALQTFSTIG